MANDINQVVLIGNLCRDIEVSYTKGGMAVGGFSIASNRTVKKNSQYENEVSYFDISLFGKTAENLKPYLTKGQKVCVVGTLKQDRWEKDGQKYSKIRILCNNIQLIGSKGNSSTSATEQTAPNPPTEEYAVTDEFPEDLPF